MAIDEALAKRVRDGLVGTAGIEEKKMFGGLCWLLRGNMVLGICSTGDLMVRVGPEAHAEALRQTGARPMAMGGRSSSGMIFVNAAGSKGAALARWTDRAMRFVTTLPTKVKKPAKKKPAPAKKRRAT